jgi:hypothetical protein
MAPGSAYPRRVSRRTLLRAVRRHRVLVAVACALAVATTGSALTATNTGTGGKAGDGTGAISGYAVSGISYTLNVADPRNIESVRFTLDGPASSVRARINTGAWAVCVPAAGVNTWTCPLGTVAAIAALTLQVVAAS